MENVIHDVLNYLFGLSDGLIYVLIGTVIIDYITGVCVAIYRRKLSSSIGFRGIVKKVGIFCLISLSHIIDQFLIQSGNALRVATTAFYISNECISIFENISNLDIPMPQKLKDVLKHLEKYTDSK